MSPECQTPERVVSPGDGLSAAFEKTLDLPFHIAVVGALPEDPVAPGADGERRSVIADVRRDEVLGPLPAQRLEREIAGDAARIRTDLVPELVFVEDLDDLVLPVVAADEETVGTFGRPLDEPRVPRQEDAVLAPGDGDEVPVLGLGEIEDVEAEDLEPLGQPAEHAIGDESHRATS